MHRMSIYDYIFLDHEVFIIEITCIATRLHGNWILQSNVKWLCDSSFLLCHGIKILLKCSCRKISLKISWLVFLVKVPVIIETFLAGECPCACDRRDFLLIVA